MSPRVRAFLTTHAERGQAMTAERIRATARAVDSTGAPVPVPPETVTAMIEFEERYGGLGYRLLSGNRIGYGLGGEAVAYQTGLGWAFPAILDGDWTWTVDLLVDGRASMAMPAPAPYKVINSSVGQRLESHALLAAVRHWPHRGFTVAVPPAVTPTLADQLLPPAVPEATGPAEMWWYARDLAVQLELHSWWEEDDSWTMRCFTRQPDALDDAVTAVTRSLRGPAVEGEDWCSLCAHLVPAGRSCPTVAQPHPVSARPGRQQPWSGHASAAPTNGRLSSASRATAWAGAGWTAISSFMRSAARR
jgi:hypothetical protein